MRSHDHPCLPGCDCLIDLPFLFRCVGSRQKHRLVLFQQTIFFQKFRQRLIMLFCKYLGRNHDCTLITIFCRHDHRQKRYDRLTASHISLHQTGHQFFAPQILLDLIPDVLLCPGQLIRQILDHFLRLPDFFHPVVVFIRRRLFFQLLQPQDK